MSRILSAYPSSICRRDPSEGAGAFSLVGSVTVARRQERVGAGGADDAFILLTSGTTSRPKMVPLTHAGVCLSAYNVGATLALGPQDRLLNVLPLFHAHGLFSGLLAALAAGSSVVCTPGFDPAAFFGWLTEFRPTWYTAVPTIHRALLSAATSPQAQHPAALVASHSFGLFVAAVRRGQRTGIAVWRPGDRYLRHDGSRFPDCREPSGTTQARFGWQARRVPRSRSWTKGADGCQPANGERSRCGALPSPGDTMTMPPPTKPHFGMAGSEPATSDTWIATDISSLLAGSRTSSTGEGKRSRPATSRRRLLSHPDVIEAVAFPVSHRRLGEDVAAAVVLRPGAKVTAHRASSLRPRTPGQVQSPWPDPFCGGDPEGPERKDQARRTGRRRFNDRAKRERRTRRQDSSAPLGIGTAAGRNLDGTAGVGSDWG